jgi:hypothetical protein
LHLQFLLLWPLPAKSGTPCPRRLLCAERL